MCFSAGTHVRAICEKCQGSNVQLAYPVWMHPNDSDRFVSVDWDATPYTDNGNLLYVNRGGVNWTYTYIDGLYLDTETLTVDSKTYSLDYAYNAEGRLTQRILPSGNVIDLTLNGLGQVHKVSQGAVDYAYDVYYDVTGTMGSAFFSNGFRRTTTATDRQQPHVIGVDKWPTVAINMTYEYDKRGNITDIVDAAVGGNDRAYWYDGLGRLERAEGPWGVGTYDYDTFGNIRSKVVGGVTTSLTYDTATNRATYTNRSAGGAGSILYDLRGNVTTLGSQTFTYDYSDQPVSQGGSVSATYTYDGNLKRVKQTINGTTIYSVYDQAGNLVYRDNDSTLVKTDYVSMPFASLQLKSTGAVEHVYNDHLGSPIVATDGAGTILWREKYKPYGQKMDDPAGNNDEPGFTGHVQDDVTDLTYMQARFYDPEIGRFLSIDPVGFVVDNPMSFNRYLYVNNSPVNYTDPNGEFLLQAAGIAGGAILGALATAANDIIRGDLSSVGTYAGAALGGATAGLVLTSTGNVAAAGMAGRAVVGVAAGVSGGTIGSVTQQITDNGMSVDGAEVIESAVVGGIVGMVAPGVKVPGMTSGRNSFQAVGRQVDTKLANGTVNTASVTTQAKALTAVVVEGSGAAVLEVSALNATAENDELVE